jgi:hypothetical protein
VTITGSNPANSIRSWRADEIINGQLCVLYRPRSDYGSGARGRFHCRPKLRRASRLDAIGSRIADQLTESDEGSNSEGWAMNGFIDSLILGTAVACSFATAFVVQKATLGLILKAMDLKRS